MTRTRRLAGGAVVAGVIALASAGAVDAAGTSTARRPPEPKPKPPALVLSGTGTFTIRDYGDAAVNGTGELQRRGSRRPKPVEVAAVVGPDDRTLPGPGECEGAITTVTAYRERGLDLTLIGYGEVCGTDPQPPTSIVTHVFTGTYEVLDGPRRLVGTDGFFEVRLAVDGSASVFATDT
jgi:hypothetical protein